MKLTCRNCSNTGKDILGNRCTCSKGVSIQNTLGKNKMNEDNLKPFNLEKALAGDPVITRNCRKVLQISYFSDAQDQYKLMVLVEGRDCPISFYPTGKFYSSKEDDFDLFMAPKKIKGYIAILHLKNVGCYSTSLFYENKEILNAVLEGTKIQQIVEVEIEE